MKEIPLSQGQVAIVDDEDYAELSKHKWCASWQPGNRTYYAVRAEYRNGQQTVIYMHRVIMQAQHYQEVDHVDFDGLHNWRNNLRVCTHAQNCQHQRKRRDTKYPHKGVAQFKGRCYNAAISVNGIDIRLGTFRTSLEAAQAYDEAAIIYHGAFAVINGPTVIPGAIEKRLLPGDIPYCRVKPANNATGYVGVSWQKDMRRYTAKILVCGHRLHLGSFIDLEDAARAYDTAAKKHFGEFALLNFPQETLLKEDKMRNLSGDDSAQGG